MKHFGKKIFFSLLVVGGFFGLHALIKVATLPLMVKLSLAIFLYVALSLTLIGLVIYGAWATWYYRSTPALLLFLLSLAVVSHKIQRWVKIGQAIKKQKNISTLLTLMYDKNFLLHIPANDTKNEPASTSTQEAPAAIENNKEIQHVRTKAELDSLLASAQQGVIVKIFATWCPPCQQIKPIYQAMAQELGDKVTFVEIDSDAFQGIQELNIEYLPSFIGYKNGAEQFRFTSPSPEFLRQELNKLL